MHELAGGFIAADYVYQGALPILVVLHDSLGGGIGEHGLHSPSTSEQLHEYSDSLKGPAGTVKWSCKNEGAGYRTVRFNDKDYELEKGRAFLVSVRMKDIPVVQLPIEETKFRLHGTQGEQSDQVQKNLEGFAKQEPAVSVFFRKRAKTVQ